MRIESISHTSIKDVKPEFIKEILKRVYDKEGYKIKILYELSRGPKSFNELRKSDLLKGIHQQILDSKLKELMGNSNSKDKNNFQRIPLIEKINGNKRSKYIITIYGALILNILQLLTHYFTDPVVVTDRGEYLGKIIYPTTRDSLNLSRIILNSNYNPEKIIYEFIYRRELNTYSTTMIESLHYNAYELKYLIINPSSSSNELLAWLSPRDLKIFLDKTKDENHRIYYTGLIAKGKAWNIFLENNVPYIDVENMLLIDNVSSKWSLDERLETIRNKLALKCISLHVILYLKGENNIINLKHENNIITHEIEYISIHLIPSLRDKDMNVQMSIDLGKFFKINPIISINIYDRDVYSRIFTENRQGIIYPPVVVYREFEFRRNNFRTMGSKQVECICGRYSDEEIIYLDNIDSNNEADALCNIYTCLLDNKEKKHKRYIKLEINYNPGIYGLRPTLFEINVIKKAGPGRRSL